MKSNNDSYNNTKFGSGSEHEIETIDLSTDDKDRVLEKIVRDIDDEDCIFLMEKSARDIDDEDCIFLMEKNARDIGDEDCVFLMEKSARDIDESKLNSNMKLVTQKANKDRKSLSQQHNTAHCSHCNNVHTISNAFVRSDFRNSLPQAIQCNSIKCNVTNPVLREDKSTSTYDARHSSNLGSTSTDKSQEQKIEFSSCHKPNVNYAKKINRLCNQLNEQRISDLKIADPKMQLKSKAEYSSNSSSKHMPHNGLTPSLLKYRIPKVIGLNTNNNVDTVNNAYDRHGFQNSLPQEIPKKSMKCEVNNRQALFEEKSAAAKHVSRHISNLYSETSGKSREQKDKDSSYQEPSVNYTNKTNILYNQFNDLKIADSGKEIKSNAEYSSNSRDKHTKHPLKIRNESTPHPLKSISAIKSKNDNTVSNDFVRCGFQNSLQQQIPKNSTNNHRALHEDKSASTKYVARSISNLDSKSSDRSEEQIKKISRHQESSVNEDKKSNKQRIFDLKITEPSKQMKSNAAYSYNSRDKMKHSVQLNNECTSKTLKYLLPKSKSAITKKKLFTMPKDKGHKTTLLNYFKPLNTSTEKIALLSNSHCSNILEATQASKENSHTNVHQNNRLKFKKKNEIIQNCDKNYLSTSVSEGEKNSSKKEEPFILVTSNKIIQNHCKETESKFNLPKSSYSSVTSGNNDVIPKAPKRRISLAAEETLPRKKRRTHLNEDTKEHLSNERPLSKTQGHASVIPMRNHNVKNNYVKDCEHFEQSLRKSSTETTSRTIIKKDGEKKLFDNPVYVGSGYKHTANCDVTEKENNCLDVVEAMLKISISGNKDSPVDGELQHKPSNCGLKAFSSLSKNFSGKHSHKSSGSSHPEGDRNKQFRENNICVKSPTKKHNHSGDKKSFAKSHKHSGGKTSSAKSHNHSGGKTSPAKSHSHSGGKTSSAKSHNHSECKNKLGKSYNIHESGCDISKSKDVPYLKFPCSSNTKYESEKTHTVLNLEMISQTSCGDLELKKSVSAEASADFSSHEELPKATIPKSVFCETSTLSDTESRKNKALQKNNLRELNRSHDCSPISVNSSEDSFYPRKKVTIETLVSTIKRIFSEQLCRPWLLFDTSGIPTCCSTNSCDHIQQFNISCNINNMIQLDLPMVAVDHLSEFIFKEGVPDAVSVQRIIQLMMKSECMDVLYAAQCSLVNLLHSYPPCFVHSASYYRDIFASQYSKNSSVPEGLVHSLLNQLSQESENSKDENFVLACENKLESSHSCEQTGNYNKENLQHEKCVCRILFILSTLRDSLASDFSNWIIKYGLDPTHSITKMASQPLIATAIWPRSSYHAVGSVKGVICLLLKCCVKLWSFKNLPVSDKSVLIEILHMAAEVIRYSAPLLDNDYPFFGPACDVLANKVCCEMKVYELDGDTKEHFLHSLKPDWLAMKVGSLLIAEVINSTPPQVLSTMVSFVEEHYSLHKSGGFLEHTPSKHMNNTTSPTKSVNVNKPNEKGEVMLHVACRKGNMEKVKSLLNNPDIRVNVQDYAGWTPLQEAIVKNRIECIEALLNYDSPNGERVDTSLANFMEGCTPLMTAALYNHFLACKMLLEHSGTSLLKDQDKTGKSVFDYAYSQEMKSYLLDAEVKYKYVKKRPIINLTIEAWKKLELLLSLTIFKYLTTFKIMEITETLKSEQVSHLNSINLEQKPNSVNFDFSVNTYLYKKDYAPYKTLKKLINNGDTKGDAILDKLGEKLHWYLTQVIDNLELNC